MIKPISDEGLNYHIIIPARYASSRLPGKPLLNIAGKPMIEHVYRRAAQCSAQSVVVATDDERIEKVAKALGASVCMTSTQHLTGTDRLAEAVDQLALEDDAIVVNLQGDIPSISPQVVEQVAYNLQQHPEVAAATLCYPLSKPEDVVNPNMVKVVRDQQGFALYFSRAPIPWQSTADKLYDEETQQAIYYQHFGLYAYRAGLIRQYQHWPSCPLEQAESLEQLRLLWNGQRIHVGVALQAPPGEVNTAADLVRMNQLMADGVLS